MIKNERQYKITKKQFEQFSDAIQAFNLEKEKSDLHPLLLQAQLSAMEYQANDLYEQLQEYEHLKSGAYAILEVASFKDLPKALIRARIAMNLTQKDLAERLGWKEQIVQKYEQDEYASVSFDRMLSIIDALDLKIREDIFLPGASRAKNMLKDRLADMGLHNGFIENRLLGIISFKMSPEEWVEEVVNKISYMFGWGKDLLLGDAPLIIGKSSAMVARFKMPATVNSNYVSAYTVYAHCIAQLVLECKKNITESYPLESNPLKVRSILLEQYKCINFESILDYIWKTGTSVIALNDRGAFHGATWRNNGKNIIVIKQKSLFETKWQFDLLHELYHATQNPENLEFSVIEVDESSEERRFSEEEIAANKFAAKVLLGDKVEKLVAKCFKYAQGKPAWLKASVERVAEEENANLGALAFQVAYEADKQKFTNWWGAATNLQEKNYELYQVTNNKLLENLDLDKLQDTERSLLELAISSYE